MPHTPRTGHLLAGVAASLAASFAISPPSRLPHGISTQSIAYAGQVIVDRARFEPLKIGPGADGPGALPGQFLQRIILLTQVKKSLMKIVKRPIGYSGRIRWKLFEMIFTQAKP
jgi:hypothetical protein